MYAWIRVFLHDDTEIIKDGNNEILSLYGDSIIVCTNNTYPDVPKGYYCVEVMWD